MFKKNQNKSWKNLENLYKKYHNQHMRDLFVADSMRAQKYTVQFEDLYFDYSKNRINDEIMQALISLAQEHKLSEKIDDMFSGKKINKTENRAVLHTALRNRQNTPVYVNSKNVMPQINQVLQRMKEFSENVRLGKFTGYTGKKLTTIVNIGIGGSDLGPFMVTHALKYYWEKDIKCFFISNIDGTACAEVLNKINPEETLFIVASKTFTTIETLTNAKTCRKWLVDALGEHAVAKHFIAISTNAQEVKKFGIDTENMFEFWDFVGGRYSMWSAIGMIIAIAIGFDNFEKMLCGANAMDRHFKTADFAHNIPVILALLGIWYNNFYNCHRYCIIPYDQYLKYLPNYVQQLDMESNGKSITLDNLEVNYATGPVVFGSAGTDVQHSFFQLLHQGTQCVPADFIIPAISHNEIGNHQNILMSNALAQGEALMKGLSPKQVVEQMRAAGKSEEEIEKLKKYKSFAGNRPSNTIVVRKINPYTLGMLVAMYEHKVFVQGIIWNINSFDQFGVELGKKMALNILPELSGDVQNADHDSSTSALISLIKKIRK